MDKKFVVCEKCGSKNGVEESLRGSRTSLQPAGLGDAGSGNTAETGEMKKKSFDESLL